MAKTEDAKVESKATAEEDESTTDDVKCDNHPRRKATTFDEGNAYQVNLCEECTPPWFKTD